MLSGVVFKWIACSAVSNTHVYSSGGRPSCGVGKKSLVDSLPLACTLVTLHKACSKNRMHGNRLGYNVLDHLESKPLHNVPIVFFFSTMRILSVVHRNSLLSRIRPTCALSPWR